MEKYERNHFFFQLISMSTQNQLTSSRSIHASAACLKTSSGKYKITPKRDRPLTYEMANQPWQIATRKSWNSFNCCMLWYNQIIDCWSIAILLCINIVKSLHILANLQDGLRPSQTAIEDMFIRKFIFGTFHSMVCSEVIIKRQFNHIRIAFLLRRGIQPHKVYFLIGYAEEFLSNWMQCPITLELQSIAKQEDTYFKYI